MGDSGSQYSVTPAERISDVQLRSTEQNENKGSQETQENVTTENRNSMTQQPLEDLDLIEPPPPLIEE